MHLQSIFLRAAPLLALAIPTPSDPVAAGDIDLTTYTLRDCSDDFIKHDAVKFGWSDGPYSIQSYRLSKDLHDSDLLWWTSKGTHTSYLAQNDGRKEGCHNLLEATEFLYVSRDSADGTRSPDDGGYLKEREEVSVPKTEDV